MVFSILEVAPVQGGLPATAALRHDSHVHSVFVVCGIVMIGLTICWSAFGAMMSMGYELRMVKLSLLCLSFAACSWGMNVLNKTLVETFHAPSLVTFAQMMMTVAGTMILARHKLTFNWIQVLKWSFVPLLFCGMLVSSFVAYEYLTLSMLMVVRNLGPLVTLPIEKAVMPADKQPLVSSWMIVALIVILVGATTYCGGIEGFSFMGLVFAVLNMVLAIADRVAQRRLLTTECKDLSTETCVLLNNVLGCIPTVIMAYHMGEFAQFDSSLWFKSSATCLLIMSGVIGSGICYFAIAVQREISATSFMVLQNTARMGVAGAGILIFGDAVNSASQVSGLILNFGGAIWYGKTQLDAATAAKAAKAAAEKEDPEQQPFIKK